MCILLDMKLIWCNGFPEISAQLDVGQVYLPDMSTMCILLYMKLIWCNGFPEIYAQLEKVTGLVCHETYAVYWSSRDLCLIGGGDPSAKYEHNVHSAMYDTYLL